MNIKFIDPLEVIIKRYGQIWSEDCLELAIEITHGINPEPVAIMLFKQKLKTLEYVLEHGCCPKHIIERLIEIQNQN